MTWLAEGWKDLIRAPVYSLGFGTLYAAFGLFLFFGLQRIGWEGMILPLAAGFLLIGPLAAAFQYETSRRLEMNKPLGLAVMWRNICRHGRQIANLGWIMMFLFMVWQMLAFVLFAFFMGGSPPPLDHMVGGILAHPEAMPFLIFGSAVGLFLASIAFSISVFAMPMLLESGVSTAEAITVSVRAVMLNWRNMIGWALTIAILTLFGISLAFIGLAFTLPLVAHASWHAYRDVVGKPDDLILIDD
jgi:uncharacterized membrane protein